MDQLDRFANDVEELEVLNDVLIGDDNETISQLACSTSYLLQAVSINIELMKRAAAQES